MFGFVAKTFQNRLYHAMRYHRCHFLRLARKKPSVVIKHSPHWSRRLPTNNLNFWVFIFSWPLLICQPTSGQCSRTSSPPSLSSSASVVPLRRGRRPAYITRRADQIRAATGRRHQKGGSSVCSDDDSASSVSATADTASDERRSKIHHQAGPKGRLCRAR